MWMRWVLISTKPFIFVLFLVGVTVRSAESLSSAIPLGTSTKRANSKRANHGRSGEPASTALRGGRSSLSVAVSRKSIAHIRGPHRERQKLWAALCLPRRAAERQGCLQTEVGPLDIGGHRLGVPVAWRAMTSGGEGSLPCVGVRRLYGRHLQSCGVRRHRTPSQDSTISALSQFLPMCWVSNGWEELASVTLAVPFLLTRAFFLPQFSSPDGEPWWNPPSTPGIQTGRSSLTPGPVLMLARSGLRSAPVLG